MKKTLALILSLCMVLALFAGCGKTEAPAETPAAPPAETPAETPAEAPVDDTVYTLRIGDVTAPGHPLCNTLEAMAAAIEERSGGRLDVTVYPSSQLGSLAAMTEMLQLGTLEMCTQSAGGIASFVPVTGVLELPYLYNSHEEAYKIYDGEIGQELADKFLEGSGVRLMSYWMNFFRHTTNSVRPITSVDDFKGLNLRVPETKTVMGCMNALGANATPMAVGELYTALQQGTMDGQENPLSVIYANKYQEVQKYLSLTGHVYSPIIILVADDWYQALPDDLRTILDEEVAAHQVIARQASEADDAEKIGLLKEAGMEVNEVDTTGFREAVQVVYDDIIAETPEAADYIARIEAELGR